MGGGVKAVRESEARVKGRKLARGKKVKAVTRIHSLKGERTGKDKRKKKKKGRKKGAG